MSDLKRIQKLVKECLLADAEVLEPDHATVVYNQILTAFKAHIEGLRAKEYMGVCTPAIEDFRKALMESLE